MSQPGSSRLEPSPLIPDDPIKAVGRKVKSILSSHQRPSVRILRESSTGGRQSGQAQEATADRPLPLPPIDESAPQSGSQTEAAAHYANQPAPTPSPPLRENAPPGRFAGLRTRSQSWFGRDENRGNDLPHDQEYDDDTVDLLDVVDPEVSTLSTLTNVQNSLFVPSLGRFLNRRATYTLSDRSKEAHTIEKIRSLLHVPSTAEEGDEGTAESESGRPERTPRLARTPTITTTITDAHYAVLPDGETLEGWTRAEKDDLDDRVRHMLHSRRARFKRSMKGFSQYVRRPLGLFVTVYATLITLFGAAWVLFLIGWISLGSKRDYVINIVDNVLVALFAVIGDGLAPFRAVDTYHMVFIAYYHRKTWRKREKLGLPKLVDHNDLPEQRKEDIQPQEIDIESLIARRIPSRLARVVAPRIPKRVARRIVSRSKASDPSYEYTVLTEKEQATLEFHERKFSKSHTFYKPHETETHYAFPLKLLVTVVLLLDLHSALQISLGACTWGIPYKTRPFALTTVILCCSITCNIMGGVLISVGDRRTRKKDVIERMMRQQLTAEAMEEMQKEWMKEAEEQGQLDKSVRKRFEEEKDEAENEEIKHAWKLVPSLPKKLLGKGEDHRQPSLPQQARSSASSRLSPTPSGSLSPRDSKLKGTGSLPPVNEDSIQPEGSKPALPERPNPPLPTRPIPPPRRGEEPEEESTGRKIMKLIRRADLDRS